MDLVLAKNFFARGGLAAVAAVANRGFVLCRTVVTDHGYRDRSVLPGAKNFAQISKLR